MKSANSRLDGLTPNVLSFDPRRLTVRSIGYYRCTEEQVPEPRIQCQKFNNASQLCASYDARMGARLEAGEIAPANLSIVLSLGGAALASASVDAGWKVELQTASKKLSESWAVEGQHFSYVHDDLARLLSVSESDEAGGFRVVERYTYNNALFESSKRNSCGRLIRHDHPSGSKALDEYALGGGCIQEADRFLESLEDPDWPISEIARDTLLESDRVYTTTRSFGATGALLSHTDAAFNKRLYQYDVAGQLGAIYCQFDGCSSSQLISESYYNEFSKVSREVLGNDVVTRAYYERDDGRLKRLISTRKDGSCMRDLHYRYDPVGNVLSIENKADVIRFFKNQCTRPVSRYRYDTFYQLIEAHGQEVFQPDVNGVVGNLSAQVDPGCRVNYKQTYTYDLAGNLLRTTHQGGQSRTTKMLVDTISNRSLRFNEDGSKPDIGRGFDTCGNQTLLQAGTFLQWNGRNQLREVTSLSREVGVSDAEHYRYGIDGARVRKVTISQARSSIHRAEVRYLSGLEERSKTLREENFNVIEIGSGLTNVRALNWVSGKPDTVPQRQLRYCLSDHLKSVNIELDAQGYSISNEEFYPFGGVAVWAARDEIEASYKTGRYSGRERENSGIYCFGQRYYAPWLHRWLSADPAGTVDGLNLYLFVHNNPMGHEDVAGLDDTPAELLSANFKANVEPLVLSRTSHDQQAAENRLASEWGVSGQALGETLTKVVDHLKTSPHSVNVRFSSVAGFSGDYLKNTFETGIRQELSYYMNREGRNRALVNYSGAQQIFRTHTDVLSRSGPYASIRSDLQPGAHPTHGSIQVHDRAAGTGGAPYSEDTAYGESAFFLSEGALSFLTYTAGDSMDIYSLLGGGQHGSLTEQLAVQNNMYPLISYADPAQLDFYKNFVVAGGDGSVVRLMYPYVEWQSHNTILFKDMSSFTFSGSELSALPSLEGARTVASVNAFLSTHNIKSCRQAFQFGVADS